MSGVISFPSLVGRIKRMNKFALVVHGGASDIQNSVLEECRVGIHEALVAGWALLQGGGAAIDACEQAVIRLEDTAVFNAGFGAKLNRDGQVQLDAVLMDGARLDAGAVAAVERIRNPVSLARLVMERNEHVFPSVRVPSSLRSLMVSSCARPRNSSHLENGPVGWSGRGTRSRKTKRTAGLLAQSRSTGTVISLPQRRREARLPSIQAGWATLRSSGAAVTRTIE